MGRPGQAKAQAELHRLRTITGAEWLRRIAANIADPVMRQTVAKIVYFRLFGDNRPSEQDADMAALLARREGDALPVASRYILDDETVEAALHSIGITGQYARRYAYGGDNWRS